MLSRYPSTIVDRIIMKPKRDVEDVIMKAKRVIEDEGRELVPDQFEAVMLDYHQVKFLAVHTYIQRCLHATLVQLDGPTSRTLSLCDDTLRGWSGTGAATATVAVVAALNADVAGAPVHARLCRPLFEAATVTTTAVAIRYLPHIATDKQGRARKRVHAYICFIQ
jgi:mannitol-1-phosphate/altronate dehydrogenase